MKWTHNTNPRRTEEPARLRLPPADLQGARISPVRHGASGALPQRASFHARTRRVADMQERVSSANPRLELLRRKAEQTVLTLLRLHDWSAQITREVDGDDCIEIAARRGAVSTRIAVLYSTAISNATYKRLSNEVERIFFSGQPYRLDSYAEGVTVPVEPLNDFFPFLVELNRRVEPDRSPPVLPRRPPTVRRLTAENPLDAVMTRLRQFTSTTLARRLVEKRSRAEAVALTREAVDAKAVGIAYSMRGAMDYIVSTPREALNRRALDLYYGTMALAQAEMLASPSVRSI